MAQQFHLAVVLGFLKQKDYPISPDKDFTIGRNRHSDAAILSRTVSRNHAKITFHNGAYSIHDLGSKSGVMVNNRKVKTTILRHNDIIEIGHVKFKFLAQGPARGRGTDREPEGSAGGPAARPATPAPVVIAPKPAAQDDSGEPATVAEGPMFAPEELARIGGTFGGIKLIAPLARGRRTIIYKGTQASQNRVVAFKMLRPEAAANPEIVHWFVRSAQEASTLRHEEIVPLLGGGRDGAAVFVYLAFMENGSAQEWFEDAAEKGMPAVKRALESVIHIVRALEFAQRENVLHLGLRPSKVLYDEFRRAKLSGLGFDNSASAPGAETTPETAAYRAPEQTVPKGPISAATDIFSLGAVFYYMLAGRQPERDRRQRIPSPKQANPAVPDSLCRITEKMTDPSLEARYQSYGQLLHDLRWALRGEAWPRIGS